MSINNTTLHIDNEQIACEYELAKENVIFIHGAGIADRTRHRPLAAELRKRGVGTVLFDFSGHGESSGKLGESSLSRRVTQAQGVIDQLIPTGSTLYFVGFSMGGQIVCDLTSVYSARVKSILLGCPGIYTKKVNNLLFETDDFTNAIREDKSWGQSSALEALRSYSGRTIIAIGSDDQVIPKDVIASLIASAQNPTHIEYPGVSHKLAQWLATQPEKLSELAENLLK